MPDTAEQPKQRAVRVLQGHIDLGKWPQIKGWAWDPATPGERIRLEIAEDHKRVLTAVASVSRPDLGVAGIGDGLHGFAIDLNESVLGAGQHTLTLRCADTGAELPGSPIVVSVPARAAAGDLATAAPTPESSARAALAVEPPAARQKPADPVRVEPLPGLSAAAPDETVLATARAAEFREDLLAAGLRRGNCAFYIRVPAKLFDGKFRNLQVYGVRLAVRLPIGKPFGIVFPRLAPRYGGLPATIPAIDIFEQVSGALAPTADQPDLETIEETSAVLAQVGRRFGHAAALGLLYAHVLRRPIDNDGLATRLTRLHADISEYKSIVQEVMYSEEALLIHGASKYLSLHPLESLRVWLDGRFGILELPA